MPISEFNLIIGANHTIKVKGNDFQLGKNRFFFEKNKLNICLKHCHTQ